VQQENEVHQQTEDITIRTLDCPFLTHPSPFVPMLSRPDGGVRTGAGSSSASGGAVSKRTRVFTFLGGMITGAVLMWLAFTTHADWTLNMPQGEAARMSALRSWSKNGGGAHLPPEPIAPPPADGAADTPAASTPSSTQPAAASPPAAPVVVPEVATGDSQMLFDSTKWAPPTEILKARSSLKVPLVCTPTTTMDGRVGWPVGDEAERIQTAAAPPGAITLVLLTAQPEWRRLPLHLTALNIFMEPEHVYEFLIVTTPSLFPEVIEFLRRYESLFRVPIRVVNDGDLIEHSNAWGYYIQMILKMIISTQIKTRFYLVLDTDITMSWPANIRQWIHRADGTDTTQPAGAPMQHSDFVRAAYQEEPRRVHPDWWETTEFALGLQTFSTRSDILQPTRDLPGREAPCLSADPATPTFGVTPALLSTHISQRVLCRLQHLYGSKWLDILVGREYKQFISKPGMWTEYTMYYMTSVCTATLPQYHFAWNITSLPLPPLEPAAWENPKAEENTLRRGLGVGVSLGEAMSRPFPIYPLPSPLPAPMNPLVSPPFHWFANCVWSVLIQPWRCAD
jgi:hypothetical protein